MSILGEIIVSILLLAAGFFGLVGSYGLIKLDQPMTRLHAPTKATTLGVGSVLIASMLYFLFFAEGIPFHELMISLFLFVTAPVVAHFIAKAQLHRNWKPGDLPAPGGRAKSWSVYDQADEPAADDTARDPAKPGE